MTRTRSDRSHPGKRMHLQRGLMRVQPWGDSESMPTVSPTGTTRTRFAFLMDCHREAIQQISACFNLRTAASTSLENPNGLDESARYRVRTHSSRQEISDRHHIF